MRPPIVAASDHLILRELHVGDAEELFRLNGDEEVLAHTGDRAFLSVAEARDFILRYRVRYTTPGFGRWAVIKRSTGQFMGWCGLSDQTEHGVDIGFRLHRAVWGGGVATEAARLAISAGFNAFGFDRIVGRARRSNPASIRVLEKAGLVYECEIEMDDCPAVLMAIERSRKGP